MKGDSKIKETTVQVQDNIMVIEFASDDLMPILEKKPGQDYVSFGKNNDWPEKTLELYKRSVDHGAIVRGKARYITGKGIRVKSGNFPLFDRANRNESFNKVFAKLVKDFEIHQGYGIKVKRNHFGEIIRAYHVPFQKIRTNEETTKFWTSDKWKGYRMAKKDITGEFWGLGVRDLEDMDLNDEIYYFSVEDEGGDVYPTPEYTQAMKSMKTGLIVEDFHHNNAKNGFTAGTMVTTFPGKIDDEEKKKVKRKFDSKTTGSENAGRVILYFGGKEEKEPKIAHLTGDNLDQKYQPLSEQIQQKTFTGHQVVSPMIFGIKTEGQLGGRAEILEAWELFSNNYVEPKQELLLESISRFCELCGFGKVEFEIEGIAPIGLDYMQLLEKGLVSPEYVQEKLNLPAYKKKPDPGAATEEEQDVALAAFSEYGISADSVQWDDTVDLKLREGLSSFLTRLLKAVKEKPNYSIKDYSLGLDVDEESVNEGLKQLVNRGLIIQSGTEGGGMVVTPQGNLLIGDGGEVLITTMYRYSGPQDDRNRAFCARLMALNRLYTREDIDALSKRLGYDVWKYRGGWYKRPDGVNIPHCRHTWKPVIVRRSN